MMDVEMDLGEIGGEGVQEVEKDQWADLVDDNGIPSNQKTSRSWQALNLTQMTNLKESRDVPKCVYDHRHINHGW